MPPGECNTCSLSEEVESFSNKGTFIDGLLVDDRCSYICS